MKVYIPLVFWFLLFCSFPEHIAGQETAIVKETVKDYGEIGRRKRLEGHFVLENHSDKELSFRIVPPRCSCITISCEADAVPPDGKVVIKYLYSVDTNRGLFDKIITLIPEGAKKPILLHIRGQAGKR